MALRSPGATGGVQGTGFVKAGGTQGIAQWKNFFFDRPAVMRAAGRAKTAALARFAGYVRSVARRSMRRRKGGTSAPGQPPFAHSGEIRDLLFFAYEPRTGTFVVGPLGFRTKGGVTVPELHEKGGTRTAYKGETITVKNPIGRDPTTGRFFSRGSHRVKITGTIKYPARPFMAPALKTSTPKFAESFRGTVTR
jgi:hypothetical protein